MQFLKAVAIAGIMLPVQALGAETACPTRADLENGIILETTTTLNKRSDVVRKTYQRLNGNVIQVQMTPLKPSGEPETEQQFPTLYLYKGLILVNPEDADKYASNGIDPQLEGFFPLKTGTSLEFKNAFPDNNENTLIVDVFGKTDRLIAGCNYSFYQINWKMSISKSGGTFSKKYLYSEELEVWLDDPAIFLVNGNLFTPDELKLVHKYTRFSAAQPD